MKTFTLTESEIDSMLQESPTFRSHVIRHSLKSVLDEIPIVQRTIAEIKDKFYRNPNRNLIGAIKYFREASRTNFQEFTQVYGNIRNPDDYTQNYVMSLAVAKRLMDEQFSKWDNK